ERAKPVLVGLVVADVDGHPLVGVDAEGLHDPRDRAALVPRDRRLELEDHLAAALAQAGLAADGVDDRSQALDLGLTRDHPIVGRDREALALDDRPGDSLELGAQALLGEVELGERSLGFGHGLAAAATAD